VLSARPDRFEIPEAQPQFPGGGIGTGLGFGFGIPVFGTGGGFGIGGIRGGAIPGFVAGAGSGIGPVLDLESAFDVGFTSAEIAATIRREEEAIRAALSEGRDAVITISTGQQTGLTMVLNLAKGLFEIFDRDGRKVGGGVTPEAAIEAVNAGSLRPAPVATTFAEATPPIAGPTGGGDFNELLRSILGALGQLTGGRGSPRGLEPVAIGGSVNVPVVRGSTADPTGTLRPVQRLPGRPAPTIEERLAAFPRAPATQPARPALPSAREVLPSVALEILQLLLRERAEKQLRDAQRRAQEIQAQRLASFSELIRRIQMSFGQNGVSLGLQGPRDSRGPLESAGVGGGFLTTLTDILIGLGTNISADLLTRLGVTTAAERREITVPNGDSEIEAALRALQTGGGAATQCGLFRGGGGARVSSRPASVVCLPDPITGEARFFGHLGRPLVFQRDVTMAKNIPKLIRKLGGTSHRSKR